MASLLAGSSHRRLVMLIDSHEFMLLAGVDDVLVSLPESFRRIVLGVVELQRGRDGEYAMRVVVQDDEYMPVLRNLGSAVAELDGVSRLQWRGRLMSTREWGPYSGVRRRGTAVRRRFQKMRGLSNERMNKLVELMWRMFTLLDPATNEGA